MTTRITAVALAFTLAPSLHASAGQVPRLSVTARLVHADGGAGSATQSPNPMVIAEGVTSYIFAAANLCGLGAAKDDARVIGDLQSGHVWKVTRTGVAHRDGKLTFDLEWERFDAGSRGPVAGGKQRVTLNEGSIYPIDFLRATTPGACNAAAVMVEIEAGTIEEPALADTVIQYDLWLTHQNADGKKQTKHFLLMGKQGKAAEFDFVPLRFDVPVVAPNQYDLDLVTRILGTIKGRLQDDGKIKVDLETRRVDRLERPDEARVQVPRAGGRKVLQLRPGETVEIELPPPTGVHAHVASAGSAGATGRVGSGARGRSGTTPSAPAVALKDGMIVVDLKQFLAGDRLSILLRVNGGQD